MSHKHVLVILTATNCPHCVALKNDLWPLIRPKLSQMLLAVSIEVSDYSRPAPPPYAVVQAEAGPFSTSGAPSARIPYPAGLARYMREFPMLALMSRQEWDAAVASRTPNPQLVIFNRRLNAAGVVEQDDRYPFNADGVVEWARQALSSPAFGQGSRVVPNIPAARPPPVAEPPADLKKAPTCAIRYANNRRK